VIDANSSSLRLSSQAQGETQLMIGSSQNSEPMLGFAEIDLRVFLSGQPGVVIDENGEFGHGMLGHAVAEIRARTRTSTTSAT
jgi:hypothetical protein